MICNLKLGKQYTLRFEAKRKDIQSVLLEELSKSSKIYLPVRYSSVVKLMRIELVNSELVVDRKREALTIDLTIKFIHEQKTIR